MQSKATSVAEYLASLPPDRRAALSAVRAVIRANIDKACVERMQYGMIGYAVPHSVFPAGYHCDPKQPLPFAALASQKGHMSVHLMFAYVSDASGAESGESKWFREAWAKTGKKLDMGKACVRFKKLDDVGKRPAAINYGRITALTSLTGNSVNAMTLRSLLARSWTMGWRINVWP